MSADSEICKTCGLPKSLCVCSDIAMSSESNSIKIHVERRKWGKNVTVIAGMDSSSLDLVKLTKKLKSKFATGGTFKDGQIELQGNHIWDVKDFLVKEGFDESMIEVASN